MSSEEKEEAKKLLEELADIKKQEEELRIRKAKLLVRLSKFVLGLENWTRSSLGDKRNEY